MKRFLLALFVSLIFCNIVFASSSLIYIPISPAMQTVIVMIVGILLLIFAIWLIKDMNKNKNRLKESKINKIKKETRPAEAEPSSSDIGARLKKLRQMYKDGILSKVEFEKAKNKLLK